MTMGKNKNKSIELRIGRSFKREFLNQATNYNDLSFGTEDARLIQQRQDEEIEKDKEALSLREHYAVYGKKVKPVFSHGFKTTSHQLFNYDVNDPRASFNRAVNQTVLLFCENKYLRQLVDTMLKTRVSKIWNGLIHHFTVAHQGRQVNLCSSSTLVSKDKASSFYLAFTLSNYVNRVVSSDNRVLSYACANCACVALAIKDNIPSSIVVESAIVNDYLNYSNSHSSSEKRRCTLVPISPLGLGALAFDTGITPDQVELTNSSAINLLNGARVVQPNREIHRLVQSVYSARSSGELLAIDDLIRATPFYQEILDEPGRIHDIKGIVDSQYLLYLNHKDDWFGPSPQMLIDALAQPRFRDMLVRFKIFPFPFVHTFGHKYQRQIMHLIQTAEPVIVNQLLPQSSSSTTNYKNDENEITKIESGRCEGAGPETTTTTTTSKTKQKEVPKQGATAKPAIPTTRKEKRKQRARSHQEKRAQQSQHSR